MSLEQSAITQVPEQHLHAGDRRISFREYGTPDGSPLLYCHGFPSSSREAALLHRPAQALGVRIISPDRPGYGGSDHLPARKLADWPDDALRLADHLGLAHFALVGLSGGGPFAVACALRIADRISACSLVCPFGPVYLNEVLASMHRPARTSLALARSVPWLAKRLFGDLTASTLARWPSVLEHLRTLETPPADRAALAEGDNQAMLNSTITDAMTNGARGARHDLALFTHDWGIPFESISFPIRIWHGDADATVPIAHAHWYHTHLPQAVLTVLPRQGHFSVPVHFGRDILQDILNRQSADPVSTTD